MTDESTTLPTPTATASTATGRRPRPPRRSVRVARVADLSPHLRRVTFTGPGLAGYVPGDPTGHIKLFLPTDGDDGPLVRTYTPRRFDAAANELDVDMVIHAGGPASDWAMRASPGDEAAFAGPGRGYLPAPDATTFLLLGDESAIPAIAMLLEALPAGATIAAFLEVREADGQVELPEHPGCTSNWIVLPPDAAPGTALEQAIARIDLANDVRVWAACEAGAVRRLRRTLLDRGVDRERLVTRGYWKVGEANHPDHDHADDV